MKPHIGKQKQKRCRHTRAMFRDVTNPPEDCSHVKAAHMPVFYFALGDVSASLWLLPSFGTQRRSRIPLLLLLGRVGWHRIAYSWVPPHC